MKRYFRICLVLIIFTFTSSVPFISGENQAESTLTNRHNKKAVALTYLYLLLGKKTVSDIIKDADTNDYTTETEVVTDEYGRKIALTKMMIVFTPDTTPSQLEELLDNLNATITCSVAGTRSVFLINCLWLKRCKTMRPCCYGTPRKKSVISQYDRGMLFT